MNKNFVHSRPATLSEALEGHSSMIIEAFLCLVEVELTELTLSPKLRELITLHTAWGAGSEYIWTSHQKIAPSVMITDAQIASIQQDQIQSFVFNVREKKLLHLLSRVAASGALSPRDLADARKHFSDRELSEIVVVQGFYRTLATLASIFELQPDSN